MEHKINHLFKMFLLEAWLKLLSNLPSKHKALGSNLCTTHPHHI
jgi:hypothetical protein